MFESESGDSGSDVDSGSDMALGQAGALGVGPGRADSEAGRVQVGVTVSLARRFFYVFCLLVSVSGILVSS